MVLRLQEITAIYKNMHNISFIKPLQNNNDEAVFLYIIKLANRLEFNGSL
jgi:hypothetical protein